MMYLFRTLSNTYDGALYEYSDRFLVVNHSHKKSPSQMFSKVLNMHPVETQFPLFFLLPKAQYTWSKIRRASFSFILGRVPGLNFFHLFLKIENLLKFSESVKNIQERRGSRGFLSRCPFFWSISSLLQTWNDPSRFFWIMP